MAPSGTWKSETIAGGGVVYDLGTHLIDQVVAVAGLPKKITGFLGTQRESNTSGYEDSCTVLLHYDGMLATVKASVVSPEVDQLRFWVRGSKGSFKKVFAVTRFAPVELIKSHSTIWTARKIN